VRPRAPSRASRRRGARGARPGPPPPRPNGRRRRRPRRAPRCRAAGFRPAHHSVQPRQVRRQRHRDGHFGRLRFRPRPEHGDAAVARRAPRRAHPPASQGPARRPPSRRQVGRVGRDDVDRQPCPAQRTVEREDQPEVVEVAALRLRLPGPGGGIVEDDRHGRGAGLRPRASPRSRARPAAPRQGPARGAVGAQEAGVHLLLREGGLPPAEVADHLGPVGEGFPGPEPDHAGQRRGVPRRPVHRAQAAAPSSTSGPAPHAPVEVVVEGLHVGIALPEVARLVVGRRPRSGRRGSRADSCPSLRRRGPRRPPSGRRRASGPCSCGSAGGRVSLRMMSACARLKRTTWSEEKRRKSMTVGRVRLGHGEVRQVDLVEVAYSIDQKTLPQARFSASGDW
jgi:hypothetical protein